MRAGVQLLLAQAAAGAARVRVAVLVELARCQALLREPRARGTLAQAAALCCEGQETACGCAHWPAARTAFSGAPGQGRARGAYGDGLSSVSQVHGQGLVRSSCTGALHAWCLLCMVCAGGPES